LLTEYLLNRKVRLGRKLSREQGKVDFSYPAEVEQFRSDLRDWLSENLTDELVAARRPPGRDDAAIEMLRAWSATMADAGWAAVSWPREYGGRGATVLEQLVYTEETTRARAPMPLNVIGLNNIAPAIMQYGTEDQKLTLLPRMMRADDIWCQGMSEPEAGSDLAALRTRAVRDGDDFVVNGQKIWTSLGHRANWCQLYVRTDPDAPKHKGISCLIVDMTLPGIEVRPLVTLNGDADFAEVFFHDVRVPAGALLGPLNAGWQVATTTLSHERAGAARLYAEMQVRLEELVDDIAAAQEGREPGPLQDPVTLRRLGEIALRIKYLEVLCQRSISATLHGGPEKVALGSASLAKTVWGEIGQDMAALAYDVLGTRGTGAPWANYRLTSRSLTIAGGTSQINKNITAQRVLGLPRK
jgi:alkylation response protein AidB-like acyl-CoA dehydrogenase